MIRSEQNGQTVIEFDPAEAEQLMNDFHIVAAMLDNTPHFEDEARAERIRRLAHLL
jgi:hypothetical protein